MPPRERPAERGARRGRLLRSELGCELHEARLAAGLTQRAVGAAVGVSGSTTSRIEAGAAPGVSIDRLARLFAVVGMELSVRAYLAGPPLRDAAHLALIGRFRSRVGSTWRWAAEVPVDRPGDLRAWDGNLVGAGIRIGVEAETRLRDLQALLRRIEAKRRDSLVDRVVLLVADTRANRVSLRSAAQALGEAFTVKPRDAWAALAEGRDPGGDAIVVV